MFCGQKIWCNRSFAPKTWSIWRPRASLRPDEHSSRPGSENKHKKRHYSATATKNKMDNFMFKKGYSGWCKWAKEHITVNYNYQTIMCVIFSSKLTLEVAFFFGGGGGGSSECQATKFLQRIFFVPLCIHFWCVSDVALHWNKCLTTIKLTKKWLTAAIEAFHVEKSPKK